MPPRKSEARAAREDLDARGLRFAVVASRFNEGVTERLLAGALEALARLGARSADVTVVRVAGAFELPSAAAAAVAAGRCDAVVALGCLIRGETLHFELIAGEVIRGLGELARTAKVAVGFGVLATDNLAQAMARSGGRHGNAGAHAAEAAVEQARVLATLSRARGRS